MSMIEWGDERLPQRFWNKVYPEPNTGCWLWGASSDWKGYGKFCVAKRNLMAHRWSYTMLVGDIPEGRQIDHLCRQKGCVRPDHLEPVTAQVNMLRGPTVAATNAAKTACPQEHPLTEDNVLSDRLGRRKCRTCANERKMAAYRAQHPEERGFGYWQRKQTHCKHGHEFTEDNVRWTQGKRGWLYRACKACERARAQAKKEARAQAS